MPPALSYRTRLQKMIHDLTSSLTHSNARLHAAAREVHDLTHALAHSNARLYAATREVDNLRTSLTDSNAQLHDATRGVDDLRTSLTDMDARLYAATTEMYAQTPFRGIYVSPYPSSFSGEVQVQIKLPGETQYQMLWSTQGDEPQVMDGAQKDMYRRHGIRLPGLFVDREEVDKSVLICHTTLQGTRTWMSFEARGEELTG